MNSVGINVSITIWILDGGFKITCWGETVDLLAGRLDHSLKERFLPRVINRNVKVLHALLLLMFNI